MDAKQEPTKPNHLIQLEKEGKYRSTHDGTQWVVACTRCRTRYGITPKHEQSGIYILRLLDHAASHEPE